jgi:flagellar hook-length control protein FliK
MTPPAVAPPAPVSMPQTAAPPGSGPPSEAASGGPPFGTILNTARTAAAEGHQGTGTKSGNQAKAKSATGDQLIAAAVAFLTGRAPLAASSGDGTNSSGTGASSSDGATGSAASAGTNAAEPGAAASATLAAQQSAAPATNATSLSGAPAGAGGSGSGAGAGSAAGQPAADTDAASQQAAEAAQQAAGAAQALPTAAPLTAPVATGSYGLPSGAAAAGTSATAPPVGGLVAGQPAASGSAAAASTAAPPTTGASDAATSQASTDPSPQTPDVKQADAKQPLDQASGLAAGAGPGAADASQTQAQTSTSASPAPAQATLPTGGSHTGTGAQEHGYTGGQAAAGPAGGAAVSAGAGAQAGELFSVENADQGQSTQASTPALPPGLVHTSVSLQDAVDAVRATFTAANQAGISSARITLSPASLGGIKISISQTPDGLVARLAADHPEAVQTLQQSAGDLRRSLEAGGVSLLRLDIGGTGQSLSGFSGSDHEGSAPGSQTSGSGDPETADGEETSTPTELTIELSSGSLVNVLA